MKIWLNDYSIIEGSTESSTENSLLESSTESSIVNGSHYRTFYKNKVHNVNFTSVNWYQISDS